MLWVCDSSTKIRRFLSCWLGMKFHMIRGPIASSADFPERVTRFPVVVRIR